MSKREEFIGLAALAFEKGAIKKLVFSRPIASEIQKVSGRLCAHRGKNILSLEYFLPGNTVSHKNIGRSELESTLLPLAEEYKQINLITALGDAEFRISSSGKEALLGTEKLERKLGGDTPSFVSAVETLDREKNYILSGSEEFLNALGISDKNGRVHDKRQGKFRQINRFLEYIEGVYGDLPSSGDILIYDLCCGKSYLSFAVYYYLTEVKERRVRLLGIDLKRDVIDWCSSLARSLGFVGMTFVTDDIKNTPEGEVPDMVISLHACDIATDIVIDRAAELGAKVILSTPCCHRYLNDKVSNEALAFVTRFPHLKNKLCEALTDAIRAARLEAFGYTVTVTELTDPDDTPKNTLLKAIKSKNTKSEAKESYNNILEYVLGAGKENYLKEIK